MVTADKEGIIFEKDGVYYIDMKKMTDLILSGKSWSDIKLTQLYGSISIDTADPARSNSGNMFAALLANVLNGGNTVGENEIDALSDADIQRIAWEKHGFRTGSFTISSNEEIAVPGITQELTSVTNTPEYRVMKKIIEALQ